MTLKYNSHGHPYEDLTEENKKLKKRIQELDNSLSIALDINHKYQREGVALMKNRPLDTMDEVAYRELQAENEKLKKKVRDAEGETSLVKAIGINSPEIKALQKEVYKLKADLARAKEDHQFDNLVHKKEIESLAKNNE
jgi:predicted ribosome quality control (RQC) complex YloA/Tae2 family protein